MIGAFPVIGPTAPNPAGSAASTESVHPEFFSRGCVQRNQSALFSRYIRDVPDHKRTKAKTTDLTRVVGPGNFQLVDIFGSNLLEGGIVRAVRTAQVICPTDGRLLAVTDCNRQCDQHNRGERGSDKVCFHDESFWGSDLRNAQYSLRVEDSQKILSHRPGENVSALIKRTFFSCGS